MNYFAEFVFIVICVFGLLFGAGLMLVAILPKAFKNELHKLLFKTGPVERTDKRTGPGGR